jgi:outer membrane protein OmpA-like peptidoglycan-associated protein
MLHAIVVALLWLMIAPMAHAQQDREGKDYPGISRMPGFYIEDYTESQFNSFTFTVMENGKEKQVPVEGHMYRYRYDRQKATPPVSDLQVIRNFQNAMRSAGGQVLRDAGTQDRQTTLRLVKPDREVWVAVATAAHGNLYNLVVVEKQAMQQVVTMDAKAMAQDLGDAGRVAIYGIHFDTGKAELKPDSAPALGEIAKLLKQNPSLKVYIVGHTDMVADLALNLKLSLARAQAVVNSLVSQNGIASARLSAFGAGPYAPVATNTTEEGRAKNRRVELVKIEAK